MTNDLRMIEKKTLEFYDQNTKEFYEHTVGLDMSAFQNPFLALLPPGGKILDAGCGSGRDSKRFLQAGHPVTAFDASRTMAARAAQLTGLPVRCLRFQDVDYVAEFDGVWASASLLHVAKSEILDAMLPLARALKPGGIFFASFRFGDEETYHGDRLFNNYTEDSFRKVATQLPDMSILSMQISQDTRPAHADLIWLNVIMKKALAHNQHR